jgi:hypothetical protein
MKQFNLTWFIWLVLVTLWNFGFPDVKPIYDVLVAIALSVLIYQLNNRKK